MRIDPCTMIAERHAALHFEHIPIARVLDPDRSIWSRGV